MNSLYEIDCARKAILDGRLSDAYKALERALLHLSAADKCGSCGATVGTITNGLCGECTNDLTPAMSLPTDAEIDAMYEQAKHDGLAE